MQSRITLIISSLGAGGAERVLSSMCNYWAEHNVPVTLITLAPGPEDHYPLHPSVHRDEVDFFWPSKYLLVRVKDQYVRLHRLRSALLQTRPDVVISFIDKSNVRVLLSLTGTNIPVIVSERCDPAVTPLTLPWRILRRFFYTKAAAVVAQTKTAALWFSRFVAADHVAIIPNAVTLPSHSREETSAAVVVAMGRLTFQKGFDLLLHSWAQLQQRDGWSLTIIGTGPDRESLVDLCRELDLTESVNFVGALEDPTPTLSQAQIFVLPSRFEGFPNALLEAMAVGLPVVSFDCPSGPRDIVRDGIDGLLVAPEDIAQLSKNLQRLISNPDLRAKLAAKAPEVLERFSQKSVMEQWEALIERIVT